MEPPWVGIGLTLKTRNPAVASRWVMDFNE